MGRTFSEKDYFSKTFESTEDSTIKKKKIKSAFKLAHDVRKFEVELFWKRGTYYWAFILGSFTAYFYTLNKFFDEESLSIKTFLNLSVLEKLILLIISCISFLFSLAWVLINKGSKFWQENWEQHINMTEEIISGNLYKTFLNTNSNIFNQSPLSKKPYDYSVTQITTVTSIILMILSFCISAFHLTIIIISPFKDIIKDFETILMIFFSFFISELTFYGAMQFLKCKGNTHNNDTANKWYQTDNSSIMQE